MKKILFLFLSFIVNAQITPGKIDQSNLQKIKSIDENFIEKINYAEIALNSNNGIIKSNSKLLTFDLNNDISTLNISDAKKEKLKNLVCVSCYQEELEKQINSQKQFLTEKKQSDDKKTSDYHNTFMYKNLCNLNFDDTKKVANKIGDLTKTKILRITEPKYINALSIEMAPLTMSEEDYNKYLKSELKCEECFDIYFMYYMVGENKDLEIKGVKTYKLYEINAKFLQIFPIWQNFFRSDISLDNYKDINYQEFRFKKELKAKISGTSYGIWKLTMFSCD